VTDDTAGSIEDLRARAAGPTEGTPAEAPEAFDYERSVFQIPARVAEDERYVAIHARLITQLRQEASGLEMTSLQMILIERIANGYVLMRWHEDHPGQWVGVNTEKDFVLNWRSLVAEFNKILSSGEDKRRDALRMKYQDILLEGLTMIEDADNRKAVRSFFMNEFTAIGE
jgi:hypothetical protein